MSLESKGFLILHIIAHISAPNPSRYRVPYKNQKSKEIWHLVHKLYLIISKRDKVTFTNNDQAHGNIIYLQ